MLSMSLIYESQIVLSKQSVLNQHFHSSFQILESITGFQRFIYHVIIM